MNKDELIDLYEKMTPDQAQRLRMREQLLKRIGKDAGSVRRSRKRRAWFAVSAVCMAVLTAFLFLFPYGKESSVYAIHFLDEDGAIISLSDQLSDSDDGSGKVSFVNSRPGLEFYIDGNDIAKIEITTQNEYIYAVDWTKTQHEKYWNVEYYQYFDEELQRSVLDKSKYLDKKLTMSFDEGFKDYDQIWYRWDAENMYQWAAENNFSRFLGVGSMPEGLSEEDKLKIAAGEFGSAVGHIQLDDYPDELKEDVITIKITDRQGNETTKRILVKVSNNDLRQTVVTAVLEHR